MMLPNIAYVQRGDVSHLSALTVRQVLRYAAYLRRTDHTAVSSMELLRRQFNAHVGNTRWVLFLRI
jgi:ABC-type multidrug transport system ATPase subunit